MRIPMLYRAGLATACIAVSAAGGAQAGVLAQASLTVENFRLLHANGAAFKSSDFKSLTGMNSASAQASLNGQAVAAPAQNFTLGSVTPDIAHQFLGTPSPPRAENDFSPFADPLPLPGTFGYADQHMRGNIVGINGRPAGALMQTRADASLQTNGTASGASNVGTMTSFKFKLNKAEALTFSFDATPFTQTYATAPASTAAMARVTWTLNLIDELGISVFTLAPGAINSLSNLNRADNFPGLTTYAPGKLSFLASTGVLLADANYQLTVSQTALADTLHAVPEPASLAIMGLGMGTLALSLRRSRKQAGPGAPGLSPGAAAWGHALG